MATIAAWRAATSGQGAQAGHVNQFLGGHQAQILYTGTQTAAQSTAGSAATTTNGLYLAQSFTTAAGQTAIGYVIVPVTTATTSGSSLATTTLSLYANSGGSPTGSALVTTTVTAEYANLASGGVNTVKVLYPLPATALTPSATYWLVLAAAGNASNSYSWYRSNQASGASTSSNGTTWSAQTYGFEYQIFNQAVSGMPVATWEDSGARWTVTTYDTLQQLATYAEYTVGQTTTGYLQSRRSYTFSNGLLTSAT